MATATTHLTLLSLSDIAALAGVRRPAASFWRSRHARSTNPFPAPAHRAGGQEYFSLDEVVGWLEATGLGNNPSVREEGALFVALDVIPAEQRAVVLDGLTALLALKALTGASLGGATLGELLDLADDADPNDGCLYRECESLGQDLPWWAARADALSSAAFTPAEAFDRVLAQHHRLGLQEHSSTAVAKSVVELAAQIAVDLIDPERRAQTPFVDPTGSGDLLGPARRRLDDVDEPMLLLPAAKSSTERRARRQLIAARWALGDALVEDDAVTWPAGSVIVAHVPTATHPAMTDLGVVEALEHIALAMHDEDRAVVVGPASALTNRNRDAVVVEARTEVLRTGRVRAILRLPAGLWPARSRQQLGIWVLGPSQLDVRHDDRWITVADLAATPMDDAAIQDVVTDVVAAMGDRWSVQTHAFRFARLVPASTVQAATGDLVTVAPPAQRPRRSPAEMAAQAQALADRTAEPFPRVTMDVSHGEHGRVRVVTLGELVAAKAVRVIAGNRIDAGDLVTDGSVPVIGTDELLRARRRGERSMDRLAFSAGYPSGRYTEPGDVVFCSTPGVGATVDGEGLSAVVSPARVLRLNPEKRIGLTPALLARAVLSAPPRAGWPTWPVRLVPWGQASPIETVLRKIAVAREDAERRLADLDELTDLLVEGVTSGGLTLNHPTEPDDHQAEQEG